MKLTKPSFEIMEQAPGSQGLFKHIELCGRTAYKSEDKITDTSYEKFNKMIEDRGHTAVIEHGTVYLKDESKVPGKAGLSKYFANHYSVCKCDSVGNLYVTTNYRVILQNNWLHDLEYQCEPTKHHEKRVTVKFTCDRGVSHEFVRHRVFSFVQESTRYCNYSKEKFGNEITYIIPPWTNLIDGNHYDLDLIYEYTITTTEGVSNPDMALVASLAASEAYYFHLLNEEKWTPQQARTVLPNSLKTELIMTGFVKDWKGGYTKDGKPYGFFPLRCAPDAHPQARELAIPLKEEFIKREYIDEA